MDILDLDRCYSLEHVWDQLFTVDTIWNIGETGDINTKCCNKKLKLQLFV